MATKRPQVKIEPFRHPITHDPNYADKTWKVLEDAIREIHNQNASGLSFEELYRNAYNMVLHKFGDRLYKGLVDTLSKHLRDIAVRIEEKQGVEFLRELRQRWAEHTKSTQMIRDILMYMDRTYVAQHNEVAVYQLGLNLWRDHVIRNKAIAERLLSISMDLIHKERTGDIIERQLLKAVTKMLVDLGQPVYMEDFEKPFLDAAAAFYKKEAQEFISTSDCPEYLRKAEKRISEEIERVKAYLDASTEPKITKVTETELILNQMKALAEMENSGLISLIKDDKYDDLGRMYNLYKRVEGGLTLIRTMMSDHIKETGRQLVQDPEQTKEPVEFIQKLLDERDKYEKIVVNSFADDRNFRNSLNQAFEHFVNLNQRSPEYISLFIDDKLRKGLKSNNDSDLEGMLDKTMSLFRYLQEKDVFEKYYKQHLAKRLLSGRTVSDDAERNLLVKLKTECGYQFTSKLESMFTDIKTSRDLMQEFKEKMTERGTELGVDLQVQVLTTGSWPTQPASKCQLPPELEKCCDEFQKYYLNAHSGRRLVWQTNMGNADVKAVFAGGKRHELNVSTQQMCVLMLFNDAEKLGYKQIAEATEIPAVELKRALQSLACVKGRNVLKKTPQGKDVSDTDEFEVNDSFSSKLFKVKIGTVLAQKEGEAEKQETRTKVDEDRKHHIEAAIVRIMKARKVLDHNSIVMEVTRQLSSRFIPNPVNIKRFIESLIDREYLERDTEDRKLYRYLA